MGYMVSSNDLMLVCLCSLWFANSHILPTLSLSLSLSLYIYIYIYLYKLKDLGEIPGGAILVTVDAVQLYPIIPHTERLGFFANSMTSFWMRRYPQKIS